MLANEDLFGVGSRFYFLVFWADGSLHRGGSSVPGWPVEVQGVLGAYGAGQDFITEGGDPASAADIDGDGADEVLQPLAFAPPALIDAGTAAATHTTRGMFVWDTPGRRGDVQAATWHQDPAHTGGSAPEHPRSAARSWSSGNPLGRRRARQPPERSAARSPLIAHATVTASRASAVP